MCVYRSPRHIYCFKIHKFYLLNEYLIWNMNYVNNMMWRVNTLVLDWIDNWDNFPKRNWAKFGVGVKLIVILRHIIAYFSINIRWHSQNVSSDSRKWLIKHLFPPSSCKKQINKHNSYLLLAFLQSGSVPELDMHESKHVLPGQFVHSALLYGEMMLRCRHCK